MDSPWGDDDRRYAEWYAWAKREVSDDERTCHGVAAAALQAQREGLGDDEVRRQARLSVLGAAAALAEDVPSERRGYAQWYDWARMHVKGDPARLHEATTAALEVMRRGSDAAAAARAARGAVGLPEDEPPPPVEPEPDPIGKRHATAPPPPPANAKAFYGGFWTRFAAFLIDGAVIALGVAVITLVVMLFFVFGGGRNVLGLWAFILLFALVLMWIYRAGLDSSALRGTVGKRVMGLILVDGRGNKISFMRATWRFIVELFSTLVILLGFLVALTNRRRQTLHDLAAGTLVIRREYIQVAGAVIERFRSGSMPSEPPPAVQPPGLEYRS
jgi:uncharacterized RDD family membrane protein YckC